MDLRSWNDYLENVETLTFNLLYNIDVKETEAKLAAYAAQNAELIAQNAKMENQERDDAEAQFVAQKELARLRRDESLREDEEERRDRIQESKKAQERIAHGAPAKVILKKSTARRKDRTKNANSTSAEDNPSAPAFEIQGLKPVIAPAPKKAYDPFGGLAIGTEYYVPQKDYDHPWLEKAKTDPMITTGGYDVGEYCARAMIEAFAGLGVFIADDV